MPLGGAVDTQHENIYIYICIYLLHHFLQKLPRSASIQQDSRLLQCPDWPVGAKPTCTWPWLSWALKNRRESPSMQLATRAGFWWFFVVSKFVFVDLNMFVCVVCFELVSGELVRSHVVDLNHRVACAPSSVFNTVQHSTWECQSGYSGYSKQVLCVRKDTKVATASTAMRPRPCFCRHHKSGRS